MWSRLALLAIVSLTLWGRTAESQQVRTVSGAVRSAADSTPLPGVRVRVVEVGMRTESGQDGRFVLRDLPDRELRVVFERIGIRPDTVLLGRGVPNLTVYLATRPVEMSPLVTVGAAPARQRFETVAQTSTVSLGPTEIRDVPTIAEPDVTRTVQLLPGTVAKNDFSVGLNVRGGENDQNLVRLDGVTVFNPFHLGGMFSTFDAAAVERVDFITGGFPAAYGGRLSSVLDVGLRSGSPARTNVQGAISALAARMMVDGPVGRTGATYVVGARRTYGDEIADAFVDEVFKYYFADALAKVTLPVGAGALSATGYWGRDASVFEWIAPEPGRDGVDLHFAWGNRLAGLKFYYPIGATQFEQYVNVTSFSTSLYMVPASLDVRNSVLQLSAQSSLAARLGRTQDLRVGVGVEHSRIDYDFQNEALGYQMLGLEYRPTIWSAFVEDQWRPGRRFMLRPGLRVEYVEGGADFTAISPRLAVKVFLTDQLALTGSAGRYYQALHSIRDQELPITLFDFWIAADEVTPVARSDHLVAGFEQWFGADVALSVEGYRKTFHDLAMRNRTDDFQVPGDEFVIADGDAHGFEVLLRKHSGRYRGWIAYGYAKTLRGVDGLEFPPAHDRRHTLNIVFEGPGPFGSDMGVRWGFGSPLPYTGITGEWLHRWYNAERHLFESSEREVLSTEINGERFPPYHRLDIGFRWRFEGWGGIWRPYFQVVNVYNRQNVFVYTFDYAKVPPTRSGYSQLPLFPTIGLEFEF